MNSVLKVNKNLSILKHGIPVCLVFPGFSVGLSFLGYDLTLGASAWSWKIGILVIFFSCLIMIGTYIKDQGNNSLLAHGIMELVVSFAFYYLFGSMYFYFFIFAPMHPWIRLLGIAWGGCLSLYWFVISYRNGMRAINSTELINKAFYEYPENIVFYVKEYGKEANKSYKFRNPIPKFYLYIIYALCPTPMVAFIITKALSNYSFGTDAILIVIAALGLPMSLGFIEFLVRAYLIQIVLALRLEKERHKPVLIDD